MMVKKIKTLFMVICLVSAVISSGCTKQGYSNAASSPTMDANDTVVIAYYFHRNMRCVTCLEIEKNAKRVIESTFAKQIEEKKLIWMPLNIDEPGGKELGKQFDISVSTLVLSKIKNGNHTEYKKLEKVWQLVHNPNDFDAYVKEEVKQFLNE